MPSSADLVSLAERFARLPAAQRARFVGKLSDAGIDFRLLPIPSGIAPPVSGASYAQTRIWLHARLIDEPAAYHIALRLELTGELDAGALRRAFDALVARHDALRTSFVESADGGLEQYVAASAPCPWRMSDARGDDEAFRTAEQAAAEIARAEEAEPFDLAHGPLLRAHLIALSPRLHWLVLTIHHIVADGWSIDVALGELSVLYDAFAASSADASNLPALVPLPVRYADYAQWQKLWLEAGEGERQLAFWRQRLDPAAGVLSLPGTRSRPKQRDARGARHHFVLDAALGERVRSLAAARQATPFAVLLAALHALAARASSERRIQIGVPAANRSRVETIGLIGCFVNTVVVSADVAPRARFDALVDQVQQALVDAQSHEDVPLDQVIDALGVARDASHHPLFQMMATYAVAQPLPRFGRAQATPLPTDSCFAKFDLAVGFEAREDGAFDAAFVYAQDLFDAQTVARLAARYVQCLTNALTAPSVAIGDIEWLTDDDWREIDACHGATPAIDTRVSAFVPIHARIAALASEQPAACAVSDSFMSLTRSELEARADALARQLVQAGVGPEVRVGIALGRSVQLIVALLAILKAGGAFVPLDPSHPIERTAHVIDDARIDFVITQRAHAGALPLREHVRVWTLDADRQEHARHESDRPVCMMPHPRQTAYVIYTSGSTGVPKGVVVEHGAIAMHCAAIAEQYGMRDDDRVLHFASINFDGAHECWMAPLAAGTPVRLSDDALWSAQETLAVIERESITVAAFVPGYALQLAAWAARHGAPPSLRSLTVGGEATSLEACAALRAAFPGVRIVNGYGPTETVVTPLLWMLDGAADAPVAEASAYLPVGTPVGARTAHVLDEGMRPLPAGAAGELYLGGFGVARGYHARAALTAERFVPDPYGEPGARLYRTGDLVRRRRDGAIEFLGRIDHQVKLRGLRIELGEIESKLIGHASVRDAVALVRGAGADAALLAYVEPYEIAPAIEGEALCAYLRGVVPDYMVPSHIVVMERLPRTPNGKVDRAALPSPAARARGFEPPAPGIETALAQIWCDVLGTDRIGRNDEFFAAGGHSLKAVAVAARVAERLGREVPLRALFEAPTLAAYARRVKEAPSHHRQAEPDTAEPGSADDRLSNAQMALWFLWRAAPTTASHHIALAMRLTGPLDRPALQRALQSMAQRTAALRMGIVDGAQPRRVVSASNSVELAFDDLYGRADEPDRLRLARHATDEEALRPFPMTGAPLWRARLIRLGEDEHVLSLVVHHAVADGQSISLWLDGLRRAYMNELDAVSVEDAASKALTASAVPAPPLVPQAPIERDARYWRAQLLDAAPLPLPRRAPRPAQASTPGWGATRIAFALDRGVGDALRTRAQAVNATLPMLMHAVLNIALARELAVRDQPVGVLASNRNAHSRTAMGLFVETLIVRTRIAREATLLDVVAAVRDATLDAYEHMAAPLTAILGAARDKNGDGHPLLAVLFNYVRAAAEPTQWGGLQVAPFNDVRRRMLFELELDIAEDAQGDLRGAFSFAHERIDESFARRLSRAYLRAIEQLADTPAACVFESVAAARAGSIEMEHP
ncbi:non-ribosomal peptide synthetase [Trinickia diaoshuihuensis]|uniref:non-ribosomal peptide synthetase n=1 Tax=Trinickia diaoshuihuensis TaxID=2292265 RepID=UPI0013C2B79D|nr:non-ribosomal peptide synthetase [Trinickia diaoshuihuensis]